MEKGVTMGDLISRTDIINAINIYDDTAYALQDMHRITDGIVEVIKALPPVKTAETERGEWLHDCIEVSTHGAILLPNCHCSICGCGVSYKSNFCPDCGADMR